ncbi:uncharacterized protein [Apostichopus japonicus]|uniref:uncharacterized protein isoform X2 n=1 Tax=Stichopus japonicus TaxID=307972 RepID=UPI003AB38F37
MVRKHICSTTLLSLYLLLIMRTSNAKVVLALLHDNVTFTCEIYPFPHTLLWKYENDVIDNKAYQAGVQANDNVVSMKWNIPNVHFKDAGDYSCVQYPTKGFSKSSNFQLLVQGHPNISVSQTTTVEGESITATCCVENSFPPGESLFSWSLGEMPVTRYQHVPFQEACFNSFHIQCCDVVFTSSRDVHDQEITCLIDNELQASTSSRLEIFWPPELRILVNDERTEGNIDVIKGKMYDFKCIASDSNPAADVKWKINGYYTDGNSSNFHTDDGTHYSQSSLSYVLNQHDAILECIALGNFDTNRTRTSIHVFAHDLPRLRIFLNEDEVIDTVEVIKGQTYNLACEARSAKFKVELRWIINSVSIDENVNHLFNEDTNGNVSSKIDLSYAFQTHTSTVVCSAYVEPEFVTVSKRAQVFAYLVPDLNILVNDASSVGKISVYDKPVVNLTCIAINASSQLEVEWTAEGKRLDELYGVRIIPFVKNTNGIVTSNVSIVLREDYTTVSCVSSGESELQRKVTSVVIQYYEAPNVTMYYKGDVARVDLNVYVGTHVRLTCNASNVEVLDSLTWHLTRLSLTPGENNINTIINGSGEELAVTSLDMTVSRAEVLNVTCIAIDSNRTVRDTSVTLTIEFHDFPEISICLDGLNTTDEIMHMRYDTNHSVTCNVRGDMLSAYVLFFSISPSPKVKIANETMAIEHRGKYNIDPLTLPFQARSEYFYAKCKIEDPVEMRNVSTHLQIATFVPPEIIIVFQEEIIKTNISIDPDITHKLTCFAMGGNPNVTLVWLTKSSEVFEVNSTTYAQRNEQDQYFDIVNDLYFRLETEIAQVICTADSELEEQNCNSSVTLLMKLQAESTDLHSWNLNKIIITPALILAAVLVGTFIIYRNVRRFRSFSNLDTRSAAITRPDTETICTSLDDTIAGGEHMAVCSAQIDKTGNTPANRKQSMALPKVPRENRRSYRDYASLRIKSLHAKIYKRHEVCFVLHLKKGMLLDRWMGTIVNKNGNKKSVFVTSVKEDRQVKREYHWDMYVQKVMEMPHHRALIQTVGLCIDRVNIFLLQNYQPVGTLDDWMVGKQQTASSITTVEVLEYANQIVAGMEMIVTYGFLHPGLSMKKILLTERKCCKIYDFCLKEDVSKKVDLIKGKENRPTLPPETEERNEYTWASDSWSVAICICDVFAYAHGIKVDIDGETEDGQRDLPIDVFSCHKKYSVF